MHHLGQHGLLSHLRLDIDHTHVLITPIIRCALRVLEVIVLVLRVDVAGLTHVHELAIVSLTLSVTIISIRLLNSSDISG